MKINFLLVYVLINVCNVYFSRDLRTLEINKQDKNKITMPFIEKEGKIYIQVSLGTPGSLMSLSLDTVLPTSFIVKTNTNDTYSSKNSSSYYSNEQFSEITKLNGYDNRLDKIKGIVSYDNLSILDSTSSSSIFIPNYGFILNETIDNTTITEYGSLSLSRDSFKQGDSFSLTKYLKLKNYIQYEDFTITRNNQTSIIIGDYPESIDIPYCNLYKYDPVLSTLWACNISHLVINKINSSINTITQEEDFISNSLILNSFAVFDTNVENILIPLNNKVILHKNTINFYNETLTVVEEGDTYEYFSKLILASKYCKSHSVNETTFTFKCERNASARLFDIVPNMKEISFVLNGYGFFLDLPNLFTMIYDKTENKEYFVFNIHFYRSTTFPDYQFIIFGNLFMRTFDTITFSETDNRIYLGKMKYNDFTHITRDVKEVQPLITVLFLSVVCVMILILIVIIFPYFIYRRRRRALMEKLQYDVIYKKMSDITQELSN